jgi:hypothetical protein
MKISEDKMYNIILESVKKVIKEEDEAEDSNGQIGALAQFLGVDEDEITKEYDGYSNGTIYEINGEEYMVCDSYDDAIQEAEENVKNILDDTGIEGIHFENLGSDISDYADEDWFDDALREMEESYVEDISNEGNRLQEEMENAGVNTPEEYVDYLIEQAGDPVQYYIDNFGEKQFMDVCKENNLFDFDELASDIVSVDGPANTLASYDGGEEEENYNGNTYYIYRMN